MSRFPGRYCITECGTVLARKKQYSEKHTSIREHEDKNLPEENSAVFSARAGCDDPRCARTIHPNVRANGY
jgi:hypothetical protein